MALIHGLLMTNWNWLKSRCNRNVSNMKRYMFFGSLKDEKEPKYKCPVCSHVGFAFEHIDGKPDVHWEVCRVCGFDGGSESLNKDKWYRAWKECGSEVLFDKSYEERCEYMDRMHIAERNSRECGAERSRSGISGLFFNQYISLIIR